MKALGFLAAVVLTSAMVDSSPASAEDRNGCVQACMDLRDKGWQYCIDENPSDPAAINKCQGDYDKFYDDCCHDCPPLEE